jgi:transcriptional regulator of NAD metabolism
MFDEMIAVIVATAILGDVEVTIIETPDGPKMSTLSLPSADGASHRRELRAKYQAPP